MLFTYNLVSNQHSDHTSASNSFTHFFLDTHAFKMEAPSQPTPPKITQSLADILDRLGPILNVLYTPF